MVEPFGKHGTLSPGSRQADDRYHPHRPRLRARPARALVRSHRRSDPRRHLLRRHRARRAAAERARPRARPSASRARRCARRCARSRPRACSRSARARAAARSSPSRAPSWSRARSATCCASARRQRASWRSSACPSRPRTRPGPRAGPIPSALAELEHIVGDVVMRARRRRRGVARGRSARGALPRGGRPRDRQLGARSDHERDPRRARARVHRRSRASGLTAARRARRPSCARSSTRSTPATTKRRGSDVGARLALERTRDRALLTSVAQRAGSDPALQLVAELRAAARRRTPRARCGWRRPSAAARTPRASSCRSRRRARLRRGRPGAPSARSSPSRRAAGGRSTSRKRSSVCTAPRKWPPAPTSWCAPKARHSSSISSGVNSHLQHAQDLDVDDELLVAGDEARPRASRPSA